MTTVFDEIKAAESGLEKVRDWLGEHRELIGKNAVNVGGHFPEPIIYIHTKEDTQPQEYLRLFGGRWVYYAGADPRYEQRHSHFRVVVFTPQTIPQELIFDETNQ